MNQIPCLNPVNHGKFIENSQDACPCKMGAGCTPALKNCPEEAWPIRTQEDMDIQEYMGCKGQRGTLGEWTYHDF